MVPAKSRTGHRCPHCKAVAQVYTSRKVIEIVSEKYLQCTNLACGFQFVLQISVVRALMPSLMPDPDINVPLVERRSNDIVVARASSSTQQPAVPALVAPQDHGGTQPSHSH
jgi:Ogr/Delta-like zinc finger.